MRNWKYATLVKGRDSSWQATDSRPRNRAAEGNSRRKRVARSAARLARVLARRESLLGGDDIMGGWTPAP